MEGKALVAIGQEDGAAVGEAYVGEGAAHGAVVGVGVDAQVGAPLQAEVGDQVHHAAERAVGGRAVDHAVGLAVEPAAAIYYIIGGLAGEGEEECGCQVAVGGNDRVAAACGNVGAQGVGRRVAARPLAEVALGAHVGACRIVDPHGGRDVGNDGFSDCCVHKAKI